MIEHQKALSKSREVTDPVEYREGTRFKSRQIRQAFVIAANAGKGNKA